MRVEDVKLERNAAGGDDDDPAPLPHRPDVRVRAGPRVQGGVRPVRRLLEPNQPEVSGGSHARTHARTGAGPE